MKANRRGFLGLLGVGVVSAPLAAKAAAEAEISNLTGLRGTQALAVGISGSTPISSGIGVGSGCVSEYTLADNYLNLWGKLPSFVEDSLKERSKTVFHLDPDIACKKSWSLNVKIQEQRQRNFQRELIRIKRNGKYDAAQSAFQKVTGWQWPW